MLTIDLLKQNDILKDLKPEQLAAIQTLSQNDENVVIARKTREIYDFVDTEVEKASGLKKETSEKTSAYAARVIGQMKQSGEGSKKLQEKIDALKSDKAKLEKQLKEGKGDEALKAKISEQERTIADKEKVISDLQNQSTATTKEWKAKLQKANSENMDLALSFEFEKTNADLTFLPNIPQAAINATLKDAKAAVLAKGKPEFFDNNGKKDVRFRDKDNNIIANPENLQNPFTLSELYKNELVKAEILDKGKQQQGAGTRANASGGKGGQTVSISGAKTKTEATEAIKQSLLSQGISTSHQDYQTKFNEAYSTPEVQALPLR